MVRNQLPAISAILSKRGPVLETPLDCTSASTVSSTLLKLNESHKFALVELGIINPQQFKLAVEIAAPNIGIITNVGEAHLANLGDKFILADAKVELIRQMSSEGFARTRPIPLARMQLPMLDCSESSCVPRIGQERHSHRQSTCGDSLKPFSTVWSSE